MATVNLEAYKVTQLHFSGGIVKDGEKLELGNLFKTNVKYDTNNHRCFCTYSFIICPKDESLNFRIEVEVVGAFAYAEGDDKKEIHVEAVRKLYPYLQSATASVMTTVGISNFIMPEHEISIDDIVDDPQ